MAPRLFLRILCLLLLFSLLFVGSVGASAELWSQTCGGTEDDIAYSLVATSDGGYIMTGYTGSFGAGGTDVWLVKTDGEGNMVWNRTYGGSNSEAGLSVQQTEDGGYIVAGHTGWLEELPYDKSDPFYMIPANRPHEFHFDAYLVKTDGDGNLLWNRTYSSEGDDYGHSVKQTSDGGYVITGYTRAFGISGGDSDDYDVWLFKTDENGDVEWSRTYGGAQNDRGESVQQTSDGGYIIAGEKGGDFWLIKTDSNGYVTWNKTYGGNGGDHGVSLIQASDGGYAIAGYTSSFGAGDNDGWLVKTDPDGDMKWNYTYGGSESDIFWAVQQTVDVGYIMAGNTRSFGIGVFGISSGWLVKTDGDGNLLWNRTYGGEVADGARSVVETSDGGYVFAGSTSSIGAGNSDFWLVKTDAQGIPEFPSWTPLLITLVAVVAVAVVYRRKLQNLGRWK
jgi:hypothetical protein